MERVYGCRKSGWYLGGVCLTFFVWLAFPSLRADLMGETGFIAGLAGILHLLAACCCLSRLTFGPDRMWAAGCLTLSGLMLAGEAQWFPGTLPARWADVLLAEIVIALLMIVPALHWLDAAPGSKRGQMVMPPPECALAVGFVIAQTVLLALYMPGETLFSISRIADANLSLVFFGYCLSMATGGRPIFALAATVPEMRNPAGGETAARQQREMLGEAIRAVRANHAGRLCLSAAVRESGNFVKAA